MAKKTFIPNEKDIALLRACAEKLLGHGNNGDAARLEAVADTWEEYYGKP